METECVSKGTFSIAPNPDLRKNFDVVNPFYVETQTVVTNSGHQINTEVTSIQQEQVVHTQGSWPAKTDITDPSSCKNQRTKIDKWPNVAKEIRELASTAEKTAKLNFSLDIFADHFKHEEQQTQIIEPSIRTISILRDKYTDRYVSGLSWSDLTATKKVAICYTPNNLSDPTAHYESFIYNLECASVPEMELHPQSPLLCLEYNIKDNNYLVGGMAHGSLSLWDVRSGSLPVWTSAIENSHRGAVNAVKWISSKTAFECVSASSDGTTMTWDTRNTTKPLETIEMQPNADMLPEGFAPPFGGSIIDYHTGVPTKYMVGTVEGLVMMVNRKASDPSQRISNVYSSHYGPIYACRRHPTETKYFLTASDWSIRVYTEDNKTPLINLPAQRHYITNAVWGTGRSSVIFTANDVGGVEAWDLTQSLCKPVCGIQVSDCSIRAMATEQSGEFIMVGSSNGTATLLQLNDALKNPMNPNEKQGFNGMLGREAKRVKNYDQFLKEQKMREKKGKAQPEEKAEPEAPFDPAEFDKEFENALQGIFDTGEANQERVVIGGDEDDEEPAPEEKKPEEKAEEDKHEEEKGEGALSGIIKEGLGAKEESEKHEEEKHEEEPAPVERELPKEEEKHEEEKHEEEKPEEEKHEEEKHEEEKHEEEKHEEEKHEEEKHEEEKPEEEKPAGLSGLIKSGLGGDAGEEEKKEDEPKPDTSISGAMSVPKAEEEEARAEGGLLSGIKDKLADAA